MIETSRSFVIDLIEQGRIPSDKVEQALEIAEIRPTSKQWFSFVENLFLWLGSVSIALSVVFFVAFNWSDLSKFSKFTLVEASVVISIFIYLFFAKKDDGKEIIAQLFLLLASIFIGVLLALFGQVYQTGADPWELFFYWAILILPWAFISRFVVMWILFIVLINVSGGLYSYISTSYMLTTAIFFLGNALFLLIWEVSSAKFNWLNVGWAKRVIFITPSFLITLLTIILLSDGNTYYIGYVLLIICWFIITLYFYRFKQPNLFMLAVWCFSLSAIVACIPITILSPLFSLSSTFSLLIAGIFIIGLAGISMIWLRKVNKELSNVK